MEHTYTMNLSIISGHSQNTHMINIHSDHMCLCYGQVETRIILLYAVGFLGVRSYGLDKFYRGKNIYGLDKLWLRYAMVGDGFDLFL